MNYKNKGILEIYVSLVPHSINSATKKVLGIYNWWVREESDHVPSCAKLRKQSCSYPRLYLWIDWDSNWSSCFYMYITQCLWRLLLDADVVSFWEFSGYEPYYVVYDYLIGDTNCLYVIVVDGSEPEEVQLNQFLFWLNFVKARTTPKAPIGECLHFECWFIMF